MRENDYGRTFIRMKVYQGAYAELWMTIYVAGTTPEFTIIDSDTGEAANIEGTDWKDLRDVMDSLKIYEDEKWEAV